MNDAYTMLEVDRRQNADARRLRRQNPDDRCVKERSCAWKYACHTHTNGEPDLAYYPFIDPVTGLFKVDKNTPSILEISALPLIWKWLALFIVVNIVLTVLQYQANVIPITVDPISWNLVGVVAIGYFLFTRIGQGNDRSIDAAKGVFNFANTNGSLALHIGDHISRGEIVRLNNPNDKVEIERYDGRCKSGPTLENISLREVLCELSDLQIALADAVIAANRDGIDVNKLFAMRPALRHELTHRVSKRNPSHLPTMTSMIQLRVQLLGDAGLFGNANIITLTGNQINGLNNSIGEIDVAKIPRLGIHSRFLSTWVLIYLFSIVLIFSAYGQIAGIIVATAVQWLFWGALKSAEANSDPFRSVKDNPYSTIPLQNLRRETQIEVAVDYMTILERADAVAVAVARPDNDSDSDPEPIAASMYGEAIYNPSAKRRN
jgi:hypothetical protein